MMKHLSLILALLCLLPFAASTWAARDVPLKRGLLTVDAAPTGACTNAGQIQAVEGHPGTFVCNDQDGDGTNEWEPAGGVCYASAYADAGDGDPDGDDTGQWTGFVDAHSASCDTVIYAGGDFSSDASIQLDGSQDVEIGPNTKVIFTDAAGACFDITASGQVIRGSGRAVDKGDATEWNSVVEFRDDDDNTCIAINTNAVYSTTIENLAIRNNPSVAWAGEQIALDVTYSTSGHFRNLSIHGFDGVGIYSDADPDQDDTTAGTAIYNTFEDIRLWNSLDSSGRGVGIQVANIFNQNAFRRIQLEGWDTCIQVGNSDGNDTRPVSANSFTDTDFDYCVTYSIAMYEGYHNRFENLRFEGADGVGDTCGILGAASSEGYGNAIIGADYQRGQNLIDDRGGLFSVVALTTPARDGFRGFDDNKGDSVHVYSYGYGLDHTMGDDLVPDAGFECWLDANYPCAGGIVGLGDADWDTTEDVGDRSATAYSGTYAVDIDGDDANAAYVTDAITVDDEQTYTIGVKYKATATDGDGTAHEVFRFVIRAIDAGGWMDAVGEAVHGTGAVGSSVGSPTWTRSATVGGWKSLAIAPDDTDWHTAWRAVRLPDGATSMRVGLIQEYSDSEADFLFDELQVYEGTLPVRFYDAPVGDSGDQTIYGGLTFYGEDSDNGRLLFGTCGASECLCVDLDNDGTIESTDVCLVDGGQDADCDGTPD